MTQTCPMLPRQESLPFRDDRATAWKIMQDVGDVAVSEEGVYYLLGADIVEAAAKDYTTFSSSGAFEILGSPFPLVPIAIDPPDHSRYRRMLDKFFSPRSVAEHEDGLRALVNELIDGILGNGPECEVVTSLAIPFPSQVFLTLFGLPLDDRDRLIGWKDAVVKLTDTRASHSTPAQLQAAGDLFTYLVDHIANRHANLGTDLLSQLLANRDEGGMTQEEILGLCFLFILAGLDTVTAALGFAFEALARDPALRQRLIADPHAITVFIEEVLRVDGPVPTVPRVTTTAVDIGDVTIPAGSMCWLMLGAASRDPRRYETADAITDTRANHFGFGRGPHRCLGSHLARLELTIVIEEWLRRIPEFSLASSPEVLWPSGTLSLKRLDLLLG